MKKDNYLTLQMALETIKEVMEALSPTAIYIGTDGRGVCMNCGGSLDASDRFCPNCGKALNWDETYEEECEECKIGYEVGGNT